MSVILKRKKSNFLIAILIKVTKMKKEKVKERVKMQKIIYITLVIGAVVLAACGSVYEKSPVGIGVEYSELKKSPCACLELKKAPELPEWFS